jgi:AmiR/NasT family two-component response regulator
MLMERYRLTGPKAFAVLRRYSQERNVKMRVLAEELTSTGQLPGLDRGQRPPEPVPG